VKLTAQQIFDAAFGANPESHSEEFWQGALWCLKTRVDGLPRRDCLFPRGTAAADAWFAGEAEGDALASAAHAAAPRRARTVRRRPEHNYALLTRGDIFRFVGELAVHEVVFTLTQPGAASAGMAESPPTTHLVLSDGSVLRYDCWQAPGTYKSFEIVDRVSLTSVTFIEATSVGAAARETTVKGGGKTCT